MQKLAAGTIAALLVLVAAYQPVQAQAEGDTLQKQADAVKNALLAGTPEELYSSLAPWHRGATELEYAEIRDEMLESVKADAKRGAEIAGYYAEYLHSENGYDPGKLVKVGTFDELLAVTPAQVFALEFGHYRLRGIAEMKERLSAKWFLVERKIVETGEDDGVVQCGRVRFASAKFHDVIEVTCTAEGSSWQVSDIRYRIGTEDRELGDTIAKLDWDPERRLGVSGRRSEGEQLLGSARDMVRVQYAKTGDMPANIRSFMGETTAELLAGEYFAVRDVINSNKQRTGAVLVAMADDPDDGAAIMVFEWASGNSLIQWCDDHPALFKAYEEHTGRAAKQEAVTMAQAARDRAMANYAKDGKAPGNLFDCGWTWDDLEGLFFRVGLMVENYAAGKGAITVEPSIEGMPFLILKFDYAKSGGEEVWNDDMLTHLDAVEALGD